MKMRHSWETASADVKQLIIQSADPQTARNLCSLDDRSTELCQNRLQTADKYRICLDGSNGADECDKMSIFSERQFLASVPEKIEIFTEDPVQMTHRFYSQTYKLSNEGFAVALRKAKLMDTICAIIRPEFLLMPETAELPIPSYVDTAILDVVAQEYAKFNADSLPTPESGFGTWIPLKHKTSGAQIDIQNFYRVGHKTPFRIYFDINKMVFEDITKFFGMVKEDAYIHPVLKRRVDDAIFSGKYTITMAGRGISGKQLNVFQLSRFLKIAFDLGYYQEPEVIAGVNAKESIRIKL